MDGLALGTSLAGAHGRLSAVPEVTAREGCITMDTLFDFPGEASTVTETVSETWEEPGFAFSIDTVEYDVPANAPAVPAPEDAADLPDDLPPVPQSSHAFEHLPADLVGPFGFKLMFCSNDDHSGGDISAKSTPWTYSSMTKRLFVSMGNPIPFNFATNGEFAKGWNPVLRATPRYIQLEHRKENIVRCPHHQASDNEGSSAPSTHMLRCKHKGATYCNDDGRLSVVIPYVEDMHGNQEEGGGLHRRPFEVLFTLEARGRVLGSTSVDVRICACPGRDKRAAENRVLNKMQKGVGPRTEKVSKKEPTSNSPFLYEGCLPVIACSDVNVYPLTVVGRANYRLVKQVVQGLHVMSDFPADAGPDLANLEIDVPVPEIHQQSGGGANGAKIPTISGSCPTGSSANSVNKRPRGAQDVGGKPKKPPKSKGSVKGGAKGAKSTGDGGSAMDLSVDLGGDTEPESEGEGGNGVKGKAVAVSPSRRMANVQFMNAGRLTRGVEQWLAVLRMQQYAPQFVEAGYDDLDVIADLDGADLDHMQVKLPGHRKKLLLAAANLNKHIAQTAPPGFQLQRSVSILRRSFRADT